MGNKVKFLLIEDNEGDAYLLKYNLEDDETTEYEMVHAFSLLEGIDKLQKDDFDVILLDLNLPDSFDTTSIERIKEVSDTPIIILTGTDHEEMGLEAIRAGAHDYLAKYEYSIVPSVARSMKHAIERDRIKNHTDKSDGGSSSLLALPNRTLFTSYLKEELSDSKKKDKKLAIVMMDVLEFEEKTEELDEKTKDIALAKIIAKVMKIVRAKDSFARIDNYRFAILQTDIENEEDTANLMIALQKAIKGSLKIEGNEIDLNISIGYSYFPTDNDEPEELLELATSKMIATG